MTPSTGLANLSLLTDRRQHVVMETLFEHAGGEEALHRFTDLFDSSLLADPLLQPLFGAGRPEHVAHVTAFTSESFGGPDVFTREWEASRA
jgi:hemoglobin